MDLDAEKLLLEISEGKELPEEQISYVVDSLNAVDTTDLGRVPSIDDLYAYLVVIGKLKRFEHRVILERYLDATDVLTVSQVLETLCFEWGATADYLERVFNFALGVGWDLDDDVRLSAIRILGEFVVGSCAPPDSGLPASTAVPESHGQVIELLIGIFDDTDSQPWTKQQAYLSLCRACGKSWQDLPGDCSALDFSEGSDEIDWQLVDRCRDHCRALCVPASSESKSAPSSSSSSKVERPGIR